MYPGGRGLMSYEGVKQKVPRQWLYTFRGYAFSRIACLPALFLSGLSVSI